ncbi:DMT family transporter [Pseudonocardia sp. HH130630-07]|uniref:DMT family transporter n=1 Tax=Pseudonocardia sp. HH130630-07 TaxID=1690815 RepID=UPI001E55E35A|nr:DMT family transporter [Pseudonocardia sp. HH130630-07]
MSSPLPPVAAAGLGWGFLGVAAFSLTLPVTRIAVEGLSPLFVGAGRSAIAAVLAAVALLATRQRCPAARQWLRLAVVAGGIAVGFPLLTSYAMTTAPAAHGAVVIALLPAATAVVAVLRTGERPAAGFWVAAVAGCACAVVFAGVQGGGFGRVHTADVLLLAAVAAAAFGYAEGGLLARELGAWQTVSWALVLAAPLMTVLTVVAGLDQPPRAGVAGWAAFAYLAVVSMYLGFFAWYRGLAIGPIARVSQVQLVQPVLGIGWAAVLLGEDLTWPTVVGGVAVRTRRGTASRPAGDPDESGRTPEARRRSRRG